MALETKVILKLLADAVAKAETLEEAYESIARAANVEGLTLPPYDVVRKEFQKMRVQQ